jgi:hypothetical protein
MAYTIEEQDIALQTIAQQLENIRTEDTERAIISPIADENFLIDYHNERIMIYCLNFESEPSVPAWMNLVREENELIISCNAHEFTNEISYFVMHIWRINKIENAKPHAERKDILTIISEAFDHLRLRWSGVRQPKSVKEQKGLIGELEALRWAILEFGEHIIDGWDASGHALHDITTANNDIEAKSKGVRSNKVKISSIDQLSFSEEKNLYLHVTDVTESADGQTLPNYRVEFLQELQNLGIQRIRGIEILIDSWGLNEAIYQYFSSRFIVGEKRNYLIQAEHPCNIVSDLEVPDGVEFGQYKLDIRGLE